jgi:hypothetical protein
MSHSVIICPNCAWRCFQFLSQKLFFILLVKKWDFLWTDKKLICAKNSSFPSNKTLWDSSQCRWKFQSSFWSHQYRFYTFYTCWYYMETDAEMSSLFINTRQL